MPQWKAKICLFVCLFVWLFVCLGFIVPLENFSLTWRRHHYRWKAANVDLCSALMAIKKWGFFSVPHLLWDGHPFIMVISEDLWHKPIVERLAVELLLPVLRLGSVALSNCATAAVQRLYNKDDDGRVYQNWKFHDPWGMVSCARVRLYKSVKMHYFFKNLLFNSHAYIDQTN